MQERFIRVPRTARYQMLGDANTAKHIWIVLHGYGQLARYFLHKFEGSEKDLLIVAPEGLSRFYLGEEHRRVGATWMTKEDREHEILDHVEYLDLLASEILVQVPHGTTISVLGFSQGVATACRWIMLGKTMIDRVVLWGGSMPLELDRISLRKKFTGTTVTVVYGTTDMIVPKTVADRSIALLASAGIKHQCLSYEGAHELEPVLLKRCLSF